MGSAVAAAANDDIADVLSLRLLMLLKLLMLVWRCKIHRICDQCQKIHKIF